MDQRHSGPTSDEERLGEEWKQKGNLFFRKEDYGEALRCYTKAIEYDPESGTAYSNRAATLIHLENYSHALADAEHAIKLLPTWCKAWRRKGCCLDRLTRYQDAIAVYEQALVVAHDDERLNEEACNRESEEINKLLASIAEKQRVVTKQSSLDVLTHRLDAPESPGVIILMKADERIQAGEKIGEWPPIGTCARRLWLAEMQFHNALDHLNEYHNRDISNTPRPAIFGRLQTLEELTSAMIEDVRVGRFDQEQIQKLQLCYRLEQQSRNAVGPTLSPKDTIMEYHRRLSEGVADRVQLPHGANKINSTGWDYVRPALQLSIRSALMNGLVLLLFSQDDAMAVNELQRCVDLMEYARAQWQRVDGTLRGRTLEDTFLRQVKVQFGDAMIANYVKRMKKSDKVTKRSWIERIMSLGQWIVDSVMANPRPPKDPYYDGRNGHYEKIWWGVYYTHYTAPLAKGYTFVGFANMILGNEMGLTALDSPSGQRGPVAADPVHMARAANAYARAAAWMPYDDPERANSLWAAIYCLVRRGGYYLADFEAVRDMSEHCLDYYKEFFPRDCVPANHMGRRAASEVLGTSGGAERDQICSPMVRWPDDVDTDMELLHQVIHPWTKQVCDASMGEGHGLMCLTQVIKNVWKKRLQIGELPDYMSGTKIWEDMQSHIKTNFEEVWKEHKKESMIGDTVELDC